MDPATNASNLRKARETSEAALVDDVLADAESEAFALSQREQIAALKTEIERLRESIQQIASGSSQLAASEFRAATHTLEQRIQENAFLSVGIAAFLGFVWGRFRN